MFAFFDTETTGLPSKRGGPLEKEPHVLQLACSLYDEAKRPVFEFSALVQLPSPDLTSAEALATHGITFPMTEHYGVKPATALSLLSFAFDRAKLVVAHNFQFDQKLIDFMARRLGRASPFIDRKTFCTMEASTPVLKLPPTEKMLKYGFGPYKNPNLLEAHQFFFDEGFDGAHDALVDTRACARVYFELVNRGAA